MGQTQHHNLIAARSQSVPASCPLHTASHSRRQPRCCFIPARSRCMQPTHNPIHLAAAILPRERHHTNKHHTLNGQHCRPTGRRDPTPTRAATLPGRLAAALRNGQSSPRSVLDEPVDQPRALPPESLLHGVIPAAMWTSKLGTNYSLDDVRKNDKKAHAELQRIRWRPDNAKCADCSATPTVWAIVNHGCFVCLRCASVHRSLGTHISKPKGCTGTYLWGPDELDAMRPGNRAANKVLGCDPPRLTPDVSDAALREHLIDKYEKKRWAPPAQPPEPPDLMTFDDPPPPPEEDFFASFGV